MVIGFAGGEIPTVKANYLLLKNIAVTGLRASDYRDRDPALTVRAQAEIFRHMAEGAFRPVIGAVLPLARFREALDALRVGRAVGKIVLVP